MVMANISCHSPSNENAPVKVDTSPAKGTFAYDREFLSRHDSLIMLQSEDGRAKILVSPKYQAKVFTSTAAGDSGRSLGWVNYKAFDGPANAHMNAYGGENRIWLGPEGGKFSLFFSPGSKMEFSNWRTPGPIDTEPWKVTSGDRASVNLEKDMQLTNYAGTTLKLQIQRNIELLNGEQLAGSLGLRLTDQVSAVGYETINTVINKGLFAWTEVTGAPCLWMLDMFNPSPETVIVVPFKGNTGEPFEKIATSDYFGQIPPERLVHKDSVLFLKADGTSRGKLGVRSAMARPVAGSYDPKNKILTIIIFEVDAGAKYLNQEWNTVKPPFLGDAVNAYNDGPLADGTQMGPFYELESVSPAAFLKPGESLTHKHSVFHFSGDESALDPIARKLLGSSLAEIKGFRRHGREHI